MPLKLSLRPGELFVLNGTVLRNGDRRGVLLIESEARLLREKDILQPEDARSAEDKAYFAVMQLYLNDDPAGEAHGYACDALADLITGTRDPARIEAVLDASAALAAGATYRALVACRALRSDAREAHLG